MSRLASELEAYREGAIAAGAGKDDGDNPYPIESAEYKAWEDGFNSGDAMEGI